MIRERKIIDRIIGLSKTKMGHLSRGTNDELLGASMRNNDAPIRKPMRILYINQDANPLFHA